MWPYTGARLDPPELDLCDLTQGQMVKVTDRVY